MSPFHHKFITYRPIDPCPITATNKRIFYAVGMGDLQIEVPNGESSKPITLKDTLHAPDMALTVVSISRIAKAGCSVSFEGNTCKIKQGQKTLGIVPVTPNGLYRVDHAETAASAIEAISLLSLHRCLGHIAADSIRTLIRQGAVTGLTLNNDATPLSCDSCAHVKTTHKMINKERIALPADAFGAEVHTDVWGPSPIMSLGGRKYYVTFTDDHTCYTCLSLLCTKDEAFDVYKTYTAWAQTQHSVQIKRLRSDRGGEYTGKEFSTFLKEQGTERCLTTHDTPQHNGIAESLNRWLLECVWAILHHSGLPKNLWGEAIQFAVWLKNCTSTRALSNVTPYEHLHGEKPDLGGVPEWGQHVWVHHRSGSKLNARAIEGRWVSFDIDSTHTHHIYWPSKHTISVEGDVKFVQPTIAVHIPFSLQPEGEQQLPASQQGEVSPSTISDTTCVDISSQPSRLPVPTPTRTTTCSMTHSNVQGSGVATPGNTRSDTSSSPNGIMPEGEPNGELTSRITITNNSADSPIHA